MSCRTAILISGSGTNLQAFIDAVAAGDLDLDLCVVFSNKPDAYGLERAKKAGIPTACTEHGGFPDRESFDRAVIETLDAYAPDLLILAGFMRILSPAFVGHYEGKILNIHPALLPSFPGLHGQQQAWEYGVKVSGCTVHLVDTELDHGPIVVQRVVPVLEGDDADRLAARILVEEHIAYPEALRRVLTEAWALEGRRVVFN